MAEDLTSEPVKDENVEYTIYIRLPFSRQSFVDPPNFDWNEAKDEQLWNVLSNSSARGEEIDWHALTAHFGVPLQFLSQNAAWLYDSHLAQVRAQLHKVSQVSKDPSAVTASPKKYHDFAGPKLVRKGYDYGRITSGMVSEKGQDSLSSKDKDKSGVLENRLSTKSSNSTIKSPGSASLPKAASHSPVHPKPMMELLPASPMSMSTSEADDDRVVTQSRLFPLRPRFEMNHGFDHLSDADDEDFQTPPSFLPLAAQKATTMPISYQVTDHEGDKDRSSSSSDKPQEHTGTRRPHASTRKLLHDPNKAHLGRDVASDENHSSGSSFSDLNDISQGALDGTIASEGQKSSSTNRVKSIGHAFRTRYL